jgi:leader peptidase (prepilin peptidase) / N-methyltransferase
MTAEGSLEPESMLARSIGKIAPAFTERTVRAKAALVVVAVVVVAASLAVAPAPQGLLGASLGLLMVAIAVVDARRFIIPNELVVAVVALGLVHASVEETDGILRALAAALLRGVVLGLLFLSLRELYFRWRGREGLGLGDVKLAAAAGVWLDWPAMPIAIEIAALGALALYVLGHALGRRRIHAATRLPFGLFLAPAVWIAWLLQLWLYAF